MERVVLETVQLLFIMAIAPLVTGFVKKTKAHLQGRVGPRVWQPYFDLVKYMRKDAVVSKDASWIFTAAPYAAFAATLAAAALVPLFLRGALISFAGDLVLLVYLFALSRFSVALGGLDTGSSFGAQGASRELFVSSLAEPVLFVTILVTALPARTTNLADIAARLSEQGLPVAPAYLLMLTAFVILIVAETGRVPVDNPDTHLELTMIHEGPLLEYSGKPLALLMWSAWIKQTLLFALLLDLCLPWGLAQASGGWSPLAGAAIALVKLLGVGLLMACVEIANAKMRLFKVPRLLSAAFLLSLFAIAAEYLL